MENQKILESSISVSKLFPDLPSFKAIAIVFSYLDFDIEIKQLLIQLSRPTRLYLKIHQEILRNYLLSWTSVTTTEDLCIEFGSKGENWQGSWPLKEDMKEFPVNKKVRLERILYKLDDQNYLTAL